MASPALEQQPADYSSVTGIEPGVIAPYEVGTPKGAAPLAPSGPDYGPNNERLPQELQNALRTVLTDSANEGARPRRGEVKRCQLARNFWKNLQYSYFSETDGAWRLPWDNRSTQDDAADEPRYAFVTNYYQAFGLTLMAVLSQDLPSVRAWPQDADSIEDQTFADSCADIVELVERNNNMQSMLVDEAFYLWTDGKVGAYVRYVVDGPRFGYHPESEMGSTQTQVGEDGYICPECGAETPASRYMGVCQECGAGLDQSAYSPAPVTDVPTVERTLQMPNGQEVISIVGALELKTPPNFNHQHEFPYIIWDQEVHRAKLRAAYPHVRSKIEGQLAPSDTTAQYERTARLNLVSGGQLEPLGAGGDYTQSNITFRRAWLRPWLFYQLQDSLPDNKPQSGEVALADGQPSARKTLVEQLEELFPNGCYVEFAGDTYCCSRNESMDDHWRVMHALPGDGQDRPAIGSSYISVQERHNTATNILMETMEYGIPATFVDQNIFDQDAWPESVSEPGATYFVDIPAEGDLRDHVFTPQPAQVSTDVWKVLDDAAGAQGQFLTGAMPALFGGSQENVDTAAGQQMVTEQAKGRIGLVWRRMKEFHAEVMFLAVDVFRKNRPDDVKVTVQGEGGDFKAQWIRLANLKGSVNVYAETDEQYPETWLQKKNTIMALMQSEDPMLQAVFGHPENLSFLKGVLGLTDLVIPDDESRQKQYQEIEELLELGQQGVGPIPDLQAGPDGQPQPAEAKSPIPIDQATDNNQVEWEVCQRWLSSPDGLKAKRENQAGYLNVRAHGLEHQAAVQQPGQNKPPSESINFKDMPPGGQMQMAQQAGIQLSPQELLAKQATDQANKDADRAARAKPEPGGKKK